MKCLNYRWRNLEYRMIAVKGMGIPRTYIEFIP